LVGAGEIVNGSDLEPDQSCDTYTRCRRELIDCLSKKKFIQCVKERSKSSPGKPAQGTYAAGTGRKRRVPIETDGASIISPFVFAAGFKREKRR
jgi:hypothetical protein